MTQPDLSQDDELYMLTAADICKRLRIKLRTLQSWRSRGWFPPPDLKVGKTIRWRISTFRAWVDYQEASSQI